MFPVLPNQIFSNQTENGLTNAKQEQPGCKKVRGQSEAGL